MHVASAVPDMPVQSVHLFSYDISAFMEYFVKGLFRKGCL